MALIVTEFLTLDGVMQDPDGGEGMPYGGWAFRHGPQAVAGDKFALGPLLDTGTLLLGRRTWEYFAKLWPNRSDDFAMQLNAMPKLVVSSGRSTLDEWSNSRPLTGDPLPRIARLKRSTDLILIGSTTLAHELIRNRLVDEYRLLIFPSIAGSGARLFEHAADDLDQVAAEQKDATVLITYRTRDSRQGERA